MENTFDDLHRALTVTPEPWRVTVAGYLLGLATGLFLLSLGMNLGQALAG